MPLSSPSTPPSTFAANVESMSEAVAAVRTGAVTIASRAVRLNGVAVTEGQWLGLEEGEPVAGGERFADVAAAVLDRLLAEPHDVLTMLTGDDPPNLDEVLSYLRATYPDLELEVHQGGQAHYALLLSAE